MPFQTTLRQTQAPLLKISPKRILNPAYALGLKQALKVRSDSLNPIEPFPSSASARCDSVFRGHSPRPGDSEYLGNLQCVVLGLGFA